MVLYNAPVDTVVDDVTRRFVQLLNEIHVLFSDIIWKKQKKQK